MLLKYGMALFKTIFVLVDLNGKMSAHVSDVLEDSTIYKKIVDSFILHDYHNSKHELHNLVGEPIYASSLETTFRWCAVHTMLYEVHIRLCTLLWG